MTRKYIQFLHRNRGKVSFLMVLITAALGGGLWHLTYPNLQVDTSDDLFIETQNPELLKYRQNVQEFGDDRFLIALLEFDDVFTPENLAILSKVSTAVERLPGTKRVTSLTHEPMYRGSGRTLEAYRIGSRPPGTDEEASRLRQAVLDDRHFVNHLISADGRYAAVIVRTWPHIRAVQLDYLTKRFKDVFKLEAPKVPVHFAGGHLQTVELHQAMLREMKRLLPLTALVIGIFLFWIFRTAAGVLLPLGLMLMSLVWMFGVIGWLGRSLTPIDVILPTVLMTLSTTYSLQFLTRLSFYGDCEEDPVTICENAAADTFFPLVLAQFTTMIGMASLCLTDIPAIRQFGFFSSLGLFCTSVCLFTSLPLLAFRVRVGTVTPSRTSGWMKSIAEYSQMFYRNKGRTLVFTFGLTLILSLGLLSLRVENDPKQFFKEDAPVRLGFQMLEKHLGGALSLSVVAEGGSPASMKNPETLRAIESLQAFAADQPYVLKTFSFVDTVKRLNRAVHSGDPALEKIPDDHLEISQLLLVATVGDDPSHFDRFVNYDYDRSRIEIRVENVSSPEILALADRLNAYIRENWPEDLKGYVTGDLYMACRANQAILKGQIQGFLGTALGIFLVMWVCFGAAKVGFLAMIPNIAPITAVLGVMGYLGIRIDIATALLASVALGIAVDDTVHFIVHYMRNIRARPQGRLAVREVVSGVGRAMLYTNAALAVGFSVLLFSEFEPVRLFGFFMVIAMIMACFDDFVMMPGLLGWIPLVGIWEWWQIKFKSDVTRGIPLFLNLSESQIKKIVSLGRMMTIPENWPLMQEGSLGDEMFVILDGSVSILKSGRVVTRLGRGETVGEMGLISEHPRSADVLVNEETTVFAFGYEALERMERRYPRLATRVLHNLSAILSRRLAATTELLR
ncbi:MMPL family transporter [bacterium]|nr:MMPL family transporter [bacterium]